MGEEQLRRILQDHGVTIIANDAILLPQKNRFWLSAIEDTSTMKYSFDAAFEKKLMSRI